ncbi:MAG: N-acetyltransferase [Proteobacteria bacterium]|jgi:ribosomal protein S18 acetylase RimI-like enzyme|nr:GNAT family N-acetyltransferase [Alphaproteobacteria bacterium]NCC02820.1 N-acetyltransferase [Pseudomonadota bacterium]
MSAPSLTLRPATQADMPFLIELRRLTMSEHFERLDIAYNAERQLQRITDGFEHANILLIDGKEAGLLKLDKTQPPWMLMQIQIHPQHQKQGHGERLLRAILHDAQSERKGVTLKVLKKNPAQKLYQRVGFRAEKEDDLSFFMYFYPSSP